VVNNPPTQVREFVIGFGPVMIALMSTAIFQAQPQLIFRGSRLIVPSALANFLARTRACTNFCTRMRADRLKIPS